jgi:hypothetical protein
MGSIRMVVGLRFSYAMMLINACGNGGDGPRYAYDGDHPRQPSQSYDDGLRA